MPLYFYLIKQQREREAIESENKPLNIDIITEIPATITHPIKCLNKNKNKNKKKIT